MDFVRDTFAGVNDVPGGWRGPYEKALADGKDAALKEMRKEPQSQAQTQLQG